MRVSCFSFSFILSFPEQVGSSSLSDPLYLASVGNQDWDPVESPPPRIAVGMRNEVIGRIGRSSRSPCFACFVCSAGLACSARLACSALGAYRPGCSSATAYDRVQAFCFRLNLLQIGDVGSGGRFCGVQEYRCPLQEM